MTSYAHPNGDDFPAAATRHISAASHLQPSSLHSSGYLAGYAVECSLKSVLQHYGWQWKQIKDLSHDLPRLKAKIEAIAVGIQNGNVKYIPLNLTTLVIANPPDHWDPQIRYQKDTLTLTTASTWLSEAENIYNDTIVKMVADGVIVL